MNKQFIRWFSLEVEKRGISFREVSRKTRIASSTISAWMTGKTDPTPSSVERLAEFFDVSPREIYELLGWVEPVEVVELDNAERQIVEMYRSLSSSQRQLFLRLSDAMIGYETDHDQTEQHNATYEPAQP